MEASNRHSTEQIFSSLIDYGYSKEVAKLIQRWYHPALKLIPSKWFTFSETCI